MSDSMEELKAIRCHCLKLCEPLEKIGLEDQLDKNEPREGFQAVVNYRMLASCRLADNYLDEEKNSEQAQKSLDDAKILYKLAVSGAVEILESYLKNKEVVFREGFKKSIPRKDQKSMLYPVYLKNSKKALRIAKKKYISADSQLFLGDYIDCLMDYGETVDKFNNDIDIRAREVKRSDSRLRVAYIGVILAIFSAGIPFLIWYFTHNPKG